MDTEVRINPEYSHDFFISPNESNPEGDLAVNILAGDLISVATAHANELGIGNPSMEHLGAGWVLSRLTIEMKRYPKANTSYSILTWIESWNKHFSIRDFEIRDCEGVTVGYARSVWMVLDMHTHHNFGLSHLPAENIVTSDRECPIARQAKHIAIVPADTPDNAVPPAALKSNWPEHRYTFKYNDIDYYRHVNTVRYITLLLNSYTLDTFDECFLSRLELSFMHEGSFGDTVSIRRFEKTFPDASREAAFSFYSPRHAQPVLFARVKLSPREPKAE